MERPLWRVLLDIQGPEPAPLTEAECFAVLEFLAEQRAAGCDPRTLQPLVERCLAQIPPGRLAERLPQLLSEQSDGKR